VTSLLALGLYSSLNRPLLYDEFVYFMAGPLTFAEVLTVIHETTTNVNQGVTGAYLFSDWLLLQIFGASDVALRLPSLLFGSVFLVYSLTFLRQRGMGYVALTMFPVFMLTQELVMHYVGEARTYLPLAAATIGLLTYYCAPDDFRRGSWGRLIGWSAVLTGVLFHPYIALYWPAVLVFAFSFFQQGRSWRKLASFANPALVITGIVVYVVIASLTWIRGRANADVDPFNFLPGPLPLEIMVQKFYAFTSTLPAAISLIAVIGSIALTLAGHPQGLRGGLHELAVKLRAPTALFIVAFALAVVVSLSSIAADFWIFPRQWIASTALSAVAIFWAGYALAAAAGTNSPMQGRISGALLIAAVLGSAAGVASTQVQQLIDWHSRPAQAAPDREQLKMLLDEELPLTDDQWMPFAQVNIDSGGSVWPEFRSYYLETDWSTFFLQD